MTEGMTVIEAILIRDKLRPLSYPDKLQRRLLFVANETLDAACEDALNKHSAGVCTTCWGDGFKRTSDALLSGPCESCSGTGRRAPEPAS